MIKKELVEKMTKDLMTQGLIIKAGWFGYELACIPAEASERQRNETECAFYAGALHLLDSLMSGLDEGTKETDADMNKMHNIQRELDEFQIRLLEMFPELRKHA
jgi:hypothetical protein